MKKQILIVILVLLSPLIGSSQNDDIKYMKVIDFIVDSVIKGDVNNFYISKYIERETEFVDFHGLSDKCEVQHKILLEILINGKHTQKGLNIDSIVPHEFQDSNKKKIINLSTIISYQDIWATVFTVKSKEGNKAWDKYLLMYINNQIIIAEHQKWHRCNINN